MSYAAPIERAAFASDQTGLIAAISAASAAGAQLDFSEVPETLGAPLALGPGHYDWVNADIRKPSKAANYEAAVSITGSGFGAPVFLTADAAVGDLELEVDDPTGVLQAGQRIIVISKALYHGPWLDTNQANGRSNVARHVTIADVDAGIVTLTEPLRSSFRVADRAGVLVWAPDASLRFQGRIEGMGPAGKQVGLRLFNADLLGLDGAGYGLGTRAFQFDTCRFLAGAEIYAEDCGDTGYGYGASMCGCDNPMLLRPRALRARHLVTYTHSSIFTYDGSNARIFGEGGWTVEPHCDEALGAVFDSHQGHVGHRIYGDITGTWGGTANQEALCIQGQDFEHFGDVVLPGFPRGLIVQHFGRPADEPPAFVRLGAMDFGAVTLGGVGYVESYDSSPLDFACDGLAGDGLNGVAVETEGGAAGGNGGDITARFGVVDVTSQTGHTFAANAKQLNGRVLVDIETADLQDLSGSASYAPVRAYGQTYTAGHAGQPGAEIRIGAGAIDKTGATGKGLSTVDGAITLGAGVAVTAPTFKGCSGSGAVYRETVTAALAAA